MVDINMSPSDKVISNAEKIIRLKNEPNYKFLQLFHSGKPHYFMAKVDTIDIFKIHKALVPVVILSDVVLSNSQFAPCGQISTRMPLLYDVNVASLGELRPNDFLCFRAMIHKYKNPVSSFRYELLNPDHIDSNITGHRYEVPLDYVARLGYIIYKRAWSYTKNGKVYKTFSSNQLHFVHKYQQWLNKG